MDVIINPENDKNTGSQAQILISFVYKQTKYPISFVSCSIKLRLVEIQNISQSLLFSFLFLNKVQYSSFKKLALKCKDQSDVRGADLFAGFTHRWP